MENFKGEGRLELKKIVNLWLKR